MALDFEALFDAAPVPTMVLNSRLEFVAANRSYYEVTGTTPEKLIGTYVFTAFPETEDRVEDMRQVFERVLAGESVTLEEVPFRIHYEGGIEQRWWNIRHAHLSDTRTGENYVVQYCEDATDKVKVRELRDALTGELQHRIGNTFAIVGALARQTGRKTQDVQEFLALFQERLAELVTVNKQLSTATSATDTTLDWVIREQLSAHAKEAIDRIVIEGPEIPLAVRQSQAFSMAIYELSANSLKYGAIGRPDGRIEIRWDKTENGGYWLRWSETLDPDAELTDKQGYGTLLLTSIVPSQLGGSARREVAAGSFDYVLEVGEAAP